MKFWAKVMSFAKLKFLFTTRMRLIVLFSVICLSVSKELDSYKDFKVFAAKNHYKTVSDYAKSVGVTQLDRRWKQFKVKFERKYGPEEEEERKFNFLKKLQFVRKHNKRYRKGKETHRVGIDRFADWTTQEFFAMYPPIKPDQLQQDGEDVKMERIEPVYYSSLPESFDWRERGIISPAGDQKLCQSCWAFAVVASIESLYALKRNKTLRLSVQQLVDCEKTASQGCKWGNVGTAFSFAKYTGLVSDVEYPYKAKDQQCMNTSDMVKHYIGGRTLFSQPSSDKNMMAAIMNSGPLVAHIDNYGDDFMAYKTGIVSTGGKNRGHFVTIIGWGPGYWLINNNGWNWWGQKGIGKFAQGCNVRGINEYTIAPFF